MIDELKVNLIAIVKRFPLTISCCIFSYIFTYLLFFETPFNNSFLICVDDFIKKACGRRQYFPVPLCTLCNIAFICDTYAKRNQLSILSRCVILVSGMVFIAGLMSSPSGMSTFIFFTSGLVVLTFVAPFIAKDTDTQPLEMWNFQANLLKQSVVSVFISGILVLIVLFINLSINKLFAITFLEGCIVRIEHFIFFTLCPIMFISGVLHSDADKNDMDNGIEQKEDDHPFLYNFLSHVVIPFLLIYSVILYAYIIQIIFKQSLPKGIVASLVIVFGVTGIATYVVGHRFKDYNKIFSFFIKNFFGILLIPTFMLAVAIGVRINEYGVTISRYMVVVCSIWFLICIPSSFFLKDKYVMRCILTSLSILFIISSLPQIGAVCVSKWSQMQMKTKYRTEKQLHKQGLESNLWKEPCR